MLPLADPDSGPGPADDLDAIGSDVDDQQMAESVAHWDLAAFREHVPGPHFDGALAGRRLRVATGDVVSSATELARLTLNIAAVHHHDAPVGGRLAAGGVLA